MNRDVELAAALARLGLPLIAVPDPSPAEAMTPADLMAGLVATRDPLFVLTVVPLVLFVPDAAAAVPSVRAGLPDDDRRCFDHLLAAAAALRARWRTRLAQAGAMHAVPGSGLSDLPDAGERFGDPCLAEVGERFADGRAGLRIRGFADMLSRMMDRAFDIRERRTVVARPG